jgi:2-oxoglutarate ferredoxin oxidoreductase subunit alpha
MIHARAAKIAGIAKGLPPVEADDPGGDARVLLLGWGSTYAAITAGVKRVRKAGKSVAQLHLVHLNPFPPNLGEVLRSYEVILVPEGNLGHLTRLVRSDFLVDAKVMSKVEGTPFRVGEIQQAILDEIERLESAPAGARTAKEAAL